MEKITCSKCANILELSDATSGKQEKCPVCGEAVDAPAARTSKLAVASFACSIFAAVFFFVPRIVMFSPLVGRMGLRLPVRAFMSPHIFILLFLLFLSGVVFGYIARSRIRKSKGALSGAGSATAGIRLGWVGIAGYLLIIGFLLSFFFSTRQHILSSTSPDNRTRLVVERRYGRNVMSYVLIKKPNTFLPSRGEYLGALDFREYDFPKDTYIAWSVEPRMVAVWFGEVLVWGYNLEAGQPVFPPIHAPLLPVPDHLQIHDTESLLAHLLETGFCGEEFMSHAVSRGDIEVVGILLAHGVSANTTFSTSTVLWTASTRGHVEVVGLLLVNGADVDSGSATGGTPLMQAASRGHVIIAEDLLDYGADVNLQNDSGHTALMYAARAGQKEIVDLLLSSGADPRLENDEGYTALDLARENNHPEIAALLEGREQDNGEVCDERRGFQNE